MRCDPYGRAATNLHENVGTSAGNVRPPARHPGLPRVASRAAIARKDLYCQLSLKRTILWPKRCMIFSLAMLCFIYPPTTTIYTPPVITIPCRTVHVRFPLPITIRSSFFTRNSLEILSRNRDPAEPEVKGTNDTTRSRGASPSNF